MATPLRREWLETASSPMKTFTLDPLLDQRWERFVERHPRASIFHTRGWLQALQRTYGYEPVVFTTASESEELNNGLVFCRIKSPLTGRRLVSLPFSDHCDPLVDTRAEWQSLTASLIEFARSQRCKYIETRPLAGSEGICDDVNGMTPERSFYIHTVDIHSESAELFRSFDRKAVQQPVKRAKREGVCCEQGRSLEQIRQFYKLLIQTRRRHGVPPQPLKWFENLVDGLGARLTISVALREARPIASILTLSFRQKIYYKYGCTDQRFQSLGGLQLLLWRTIEAEKARGARWLDLGRTEIEHTGLLKFKTRWAGTQSLLTYYRYPPRRPNRVARKWTEQLASYALSRLPDSLLVAAGRLLYPHLG